jgi:hypothetical protein
MYLGLGVSMDPEGLANSVKFYPPLNRLGFLFFQFVASAFGPEIATLIYVALSALCLMVPALWAGRGKALWERTLIASLAGFLTFPFLATVDRGNNIAFAVPVILVFAIALQRRKWAVAVAAIVIGSQIKPQLGLLALGFVVVRRYKVFIVTVCLSIGLFLMSFLVFAVAPGRLSPLQEFKDFILYTRYFDEYLPLTDLYPINLSFVHLVGLFWEGFGIGVATTDTIQWLIYGLIGLALAMLVWRGESLEIGVWFPAMLMGVLLMPNPVFAYYLGGALVCSSFFFRQPFSTQIAGAHPAIRWLLTIAVVVSLSPLLIPGGWTEAPGETLGSGAVVSLLPRFASFVWLAYVLAVALSGLRRWNKSRGVGKSC